VSSDVETTIVPQLLSEIDGVERLENVIVDRRLEPRGHDRPGDPAPGRLDVKIKIQRPDAEAPGHLRKYLTPTCRCTRRPGTRTAARPRSRRRDDPADGRADVLRDRGEPVPRGHVRERRQGDPLLQGLQLRRDDPEHRRPGEEVAIKDFLDDGQRGIRLDHLLTACVDEFKENEDLPNTTNPDDWARISGKKGERIVYIRTIIQGKDGSEPGRTIDTVANTGQYL
jgi:proteasome-associated ATPase